MSTTPAVSPSRILIKNASLIATFDDRRTRIAGGCVLVEGNGIRYVGPEEQCPAPGAGCAVIDAAGCVVLPGFINTHHHLFQILTRAFPAAQNVGLFAWLERLYRVWQYITPESVYLSARAGLGELLLTGCTASVDQMYLYPQGQSGNLVDHEIRAARELGIRFHPCHGSMSVGKSAGGLPPDSIVQPEDRILQESERLIGAYHDSGPRSMCRIALAPCAPFNVSAQLLRDTAVFARQTGVRLHTHVAETIDEQNYCLDRFGKRPLDYLEDLGWLGNDVWFAHCIHLNEGEMDRMAKAGTGVAHSPTSNLRLGSGIAPVRKMLDRGIAVSLAVDGASSNDSSDMLAELRQCLLVHRILSGVASMPAEEVFWMATRGGARVLGREDIGSLEAGKAADIAIFDMQRIGYAGSVGDPLAALLFCGNDHTARSVIVNGKVVVENGKLTGADEGEIVRTVNSEADRLLRCDRSTGECT